MHSDVFSELTDLGRYVGELQAMFGAANAQTPQRAEGFDSSKVISLVIDRNGIPERISVASDWQSRLYSDELAPAISEAFQAALAQRMSGWQESLESSGWAEDFEEFQRVDGAGQAGWPAEPAAPMPALVDHPRSLDAVVSDAIGALDSVLDGSLEPATPEPFEGSVARGKLTLTLDWQGVMTAAIDPDWAERQSAATLMTYLDQALGIIALKASRSAAASTPDDLSHLIGEALSLLNQPFGNQPFGSQPSGDQR